MKTILGSIALLAAAGSGDAVVGYAISEGDTDVSVQAFIQG